MITYKKHIVSTKPLFNETATITTNIPTTPYNLTPPKTTKKSKNIKNLFAILKHIMELV